MVAKSGIRLLYISKFMKVFMDIYGGNCCRINNLQIRKKNYTHFWFNFGIEKILANIDEM